METGSTLKLKISHSFLEFSKRKRVLKNRTKLKVVNYVKDNNYNKTIVDKLTDEKFIEDNPNYYLFYPYLFNKYFKIYDNTILDSFSIASYFFYKSVIYIDEIFDKENTQGSFQKFLEANICQEEAIKILFSFFGNKSNFWKTWKYRKYEYSKAYELDQTIKFIKNYSDFRKTNFLAVWQQILIRPSFHYKYNETVDFAVGYSYWQNFKPTANFNENDAWQQMKLSHKSSKSSFKHRFRLEQRFIDSIAQNTSGDFIKDGTNFSLRFRYRFTWSRPLIKVKDNKHISVTIFDEIWLNIEKGIVPRSVNQNWFYVGLSYPIGKKASIGLGYLDTVSPKGGGHNFVDNHVLQATMKYHIK